MNMVAGSSSRPPDYERQSLWKKHVDELYELSIDELSSIFEYNDIKLLNEYHQVLPNEEPSIHLERIIQSPVTDEFIAAHGLEKASLLRNNISLYDEGEKPLDGTIEEDELLNKLRLLRNTSKGDVDIANAIRVRRSVVAYMIHNSVLKN